jgi:hypothetical protein
MVRLPLGCPAHLVELAGYDGNGRLVALWWTPLSDELMLADGTITAPGSCRGWAVLLRTPARPSASEPFSARELRAGG